MGSCVENGMNNLGGNWFFFFGGRGLCGPATVTVSIVLIMFQKCSDRYCRHSCSSFICSGKSDT